MAYVYAIILMASSVSLSSVNSLCGMCSVLGHSLTHDTCALLLSPIFGTPQKKPVAGDFCEFKASNHCENPVVITPTLGAAEFNPMYKLRPHMTPDEAPYCVNQGVCYRVEDTSDYYCQCVSVPGSDTTWTGKRCEKKIPPPNATAAPTLDPHWWGTWPPAASPSATPTVPRTAAPSASVPVVQCGTMQCR